MAAEDALYRVMVPVAKIMVDRWRRAGERVEPAAVVEATLMEFSRSIILEPHAPALRQRLLAYFTTGDASD